MMGGYCVEQRRLRWGDQWKVVDEERELASAVRCVAIRLQGARVGDQFRITKGGEEVQVAEPVVGDGPGLSAVKWSRRTRRGQVVLVGVTE